MFHRRQFELRLPPRTLALGKRTLVMGVVNVTPDSFSDGGLFLDADAAVAHAVAMEAAGADIIDVGGESTRPGSLAVSAETELQRVLPVIEKLRGKIRIPISVDTSKSKVAEAAAGAGAEIINDVTALRNDPRVAEVARRRKLALILMHMRGTPRTMQKAPFACRDAGTSSGSREIADCAGPGHWFWQELRAELRTAGAFAGAGAFGISVARGHIAKKLHWQSAGEERTAHRRWSGSNLGHGSDGCGEHSAGSAHCSGSRCGGNGAGGANFRRGGVSTIDAASLS
jgi:dihydropteroate synthase